MTQEERAEMLIEEFGDKALAVIRVILEVGLTPYQRATWLQIKEKIIDIQEPDLNVQFLRSKHKRLTNALAIDLLEYAKRRRIKTKAQYKEVMSTMYMKWKTDTGYSKYF